MTLGVLEIANIPKKIDALGSIERMEIRGEVMMSRKTFDRVNAERLSEGENYLRILVMLHQDHFAKSIRLLLAHEILSFLHIPFRRLNKILIKISIFLRITK